VNIRHKENIETAAEFLVIKGKGALLLGHDTATRFDVLRIGPVISPISTVEENLEQQLFT
jgi:hypothetical protein